MNKQNTEPFDIEGINYKQVPTTRDMNACVKDIIQGYDEQGLSPTFPIFLIAQSSSSIQAIKDWVATIRPSGIEVTTFNGLISYLWGIYGDNRNMTTPHHTENICRKLYRKVMGHTPSLEALSQTVKTIEMCLGANDELVGKYANQKDIPKSLSMPSNMLVKYEEELATLNLIDERRAVIEISKLVNNQTIPPFAILAEDPSENDWSQARFYESTAGELDIHVVRRNASEASFEDYVEDTDIHFAISNGEHATEELIVDILEELTTSRSPEDIAIVMPDTAQAAHFLFDELADRKMPFTCRFQKPLHMTSLGYLVFNAVKLSEAIKDNTGNIDIKEITGALEAMLSSPYIDNQDCERTINHMLNKLGLTAKNDEPSDIDIVLDEKEQSILDTIIGKKTLVSFIDDFTHDLSPYTDKPDRQQEDQSIAGTIENHIKSCIDTRTSPNCESLANMAFTLARSFGDAPGTRIISYVEASYDTASTFIVCNMNMNRLPEYSQPGSFHGILEKTSSHVAAWQNRRTLKVQFLDMLRKAHGNGTVVLHYNSHNLQGAETPASHFFQDISSCLGQPDEKCFPRNILDTKKHMLSESEIKSRQQQATSISHTAEQGIKYDGSPLSDFVKKNKDGSQHVFSPTDLETYWNCPRKWFVGRNGTGCAETLDNSLDDARTEGNIVHRTLNQYYRKFGKKNHREDIGSNALAGSNLQSALDLAIEQELGEGFEPGNASDLFAIANIRQYCINMLEQDMEFLPGFTPAFFELPVKGSIGGLEVHGYIDRVDLSDDIDEQGRQMAVIVDYKRGVDTEYEWDKKSDLPRSRIQGLIYAILLEQSMPHVKVVGVVYRGYKDRQTRGMYCANIFPNDKPLGNDEFEDNLETFKTILTTKVISGIFEGNFLATPLEHVSKSPCQYCPSDANCKFKR